MWLNSKWCRRFGEMWVHCLETGDVFISQHCADRKPKFRHCGDACVHVFFVQTETHHLFQQFKQDTRSNGANVHCRLLQVLGAWEQWAAEWGASSLSHQRPTGPHWGFPLQPGRRPVAQGLCGCQCLSCHTTRGLQPVRCRAFIEDQTINVVKSTQSNCWS